MRTKAILASAALAALAFNHSANAMPIIVDGSALADTIEAITVGDSTIDIQGDQYLRNKEWSITASGGSISTFVVAVDDASVFNTLAADASAADSSAAAFGIYDVNNAERRVTFFSAGNMAGDQIAVSIKLDGSVFLNFQDTGVDFANNKFGFFLTVGETTWFSQPNLNNDEHHVIAYQGNSQDTLQIGNNAAGLFVPNEFLLAWEAAPIGSVNDYADFVVLVESIVGVPEPGTLVLLSLGLLGVGFVIRSRKRRG